jgi:hypothetical protein
MLSHFAPPSIQFGRPRACIFVDITSALCFAASILFGLEIDIHALAPRTAAAPKSAATGKAPAGQRRPDICLMMHRGNAFVENISGTSSSTIRDPNSRSQFQQQIHHGHEGAPNSRTDDAYVVGGPAPGVLLDCSVAPHGQPAAWYPSLSRPEPQERSWGRSSSRRTRACRAASSPG